MPDALETWVDLPDRVVRAGVLSRPFEFSSPFAGEPFALLLVIVDESVAIDEQRGLCDRIVRSGCRHVLSTGRACLRWDVAVDSAYVATDPDYNPPDDTHIMTSSHEGESAADVIDFLLLGTSFDDLWMRRFLILFVGDDPTTRREFEAAVRRFS
jgi:hypothetical protein